MNKQAFKEDFFKVIFFLSAAMAIIAICLICIFIFSNGLPFIAKYGMRAFLLGNDWSPSNQPASYGILPMIAGSFVITLGAMVIGVPTGILTSVFMVYYCPKHAMAF